MSRLPRRRVGRSLLARCWRSGRGRGRSAAVRAARRPRRAGRELRAQLLAWGGNHIHLERLPALTRPPTREHAARRRPAGGVPIRRASPAAPSSRSGGSSPSTCSAVVFLVYIAGTPDRAHRRTTRCVRAPAAISRCFSSILVRRLSYWAVLYTSACSRAPRRPGSVRPRAPRLATTSAPTRRRSRFSGRYSSRCSRAQGFTSMLLWMRLNRVGLQARRGGGADLLKEDEGAPEPNTVLRREILAHISAGVRRTARRRRRHPRRAAARRAARFELDAHRHSPPPVLVSRTTTMVNTVASALSSFAATFATALSAPPVPFDALAPRVVPADTRGDGGERGGVRGASDRGPCGRAAGRRERMAFVFSSVDGAVVVKTLDAAEAALRRLRARARLRRPL